MSDLLEAPPASMAGGAPGAGGSGRRSSVLVPAIVGSALLMQTLDSTIIANALPAMAQALHTHPLTLNLAITAYMLASAAFLPISAWIADRFGARTVFVAAMLAFAATSALCGLAHTLPELVAARLAQGAAGAMMAPVGRLLLLRSAPKAELISAMAIYTMPAMLGPVLGPPLGGAIVTLASWQWIFFLNTPVALLGAALALRFVPNFREPEKAPLDWIGFVLTGLGSAGLLFGFSNLGRGVLSWPLTLALIVFGVAALAVFARHARRTPHPILDPTLFGRRTFSASLIGGAFLRFSIGASPYLLALMLQLGLGMSALGAGLTSLFSALGAFAMKAAATPLILRFGFRGILIVNGVISAVSVAAYGLFTTAMPHWTVIAILLLSGFFRSLQFTALNSIAFADIAPAEMSRASTLSSVAQQMAQTFGVGLAALLLDLFMRVHGTQALTTAVIAPVFFAMGVLSLVGVFYFARLPHSAGQELRGRAA